MVHRFALITTLGLLLSGCAVPGPWAAAKPAADARPCGRAADAAQQQLDSLALEKLRGLGMRLGYRCAGTSVIYQDGIEAEALADFEDAAAAAGAQIAADSGFDLPRRAAVFVFHDPDERQKGLVALGLGAAEQPPESDLDNPGFAYQGDTWLVVTNCDANAACDERRSRSFRLGQVAGELAHAYLDAITGNSAIPVWFREGVATYYQDTLPNNMEAGISDAIAASDRKAVLDALSGKGQPLFRLADLSTPNDWDANANADDEDLEYAVSYYTVKWLVEQRGLSSVWRVARGATQSNFEAALFEAFAVSSVDLQSRSRASWSAELGRAAPTAEVRLHVASNGAGGDSTVWVGTMMAGQARAVSASVKPGDYVLHIQPDGSVTDAGGQLQLQMDDAGKVTLESDGALISIRRAGTSSRRGDDSLEIDLNYGQWAAAGDREFWPEGADEPELLSGSPFNPFPDGNSMRFLELPL